MSLRRSLRFGGMAAGILLAAVAVVGIWQSSLMREASHGSDPVEGQGFIDRAGDGAGPLGLPRPEELGIVLAPGEPPPAPDPPVAEWAPVVSRPGTQGTSSSIQPSPEEIEEMESNSVIVY